MLENGFHVTRSFIYDYLVERITEHKSTNNFRALKTVYTLFASGHVQSVQMNKKQPLCVLQEYSSSLYEKI